MLKPLCEKRLLFKHMLERLTKDCTFSANGKLYKQIDGCTMVGPISVVMANIFMCKLEKDLVSINPPIFYRRYVHDIYARRKRNEEDNLFNNLNKYHQNIKFKMENEPTKFLETEIHHDGSQTITNISIKPNIYPVYWSSKIPKRYKRNMINDIKET